MTDILIPFSREMYDAAYHGRKVATTRSEPKGKIGDEFKLYADNDPENPRHFFVPRFRLIEIMAVDLETVKNLYFRLEGCSSPEEFERVWRALHRGHFSSTKIYWIHFFARIL